MSASTPQRDRDRFSTDPAARVEPPNGATKLTTAGLGAPTEVPPGGWREKVRSKPGLREVYRVGVFIAGLLFIALGVALMALPGPLTIPPVLLGLWIWSTEFRFAKRFFDKFKVKANEAWAHAKAHPVSSSRSPSAGDRAARGVLGVGTSSSSTRSAVVGL
jgi:hypothetical protein